MLATDQRADPVTEGPALLRMGMVALYGSKDPGDGMRLCEQTASVTATASPVLSGLAVLHAAEPGWLAACFLIYDLFRAGKSRGDLPAGQRRRIDAFIDEFTAVSDGCGRVRARVPGRCLDVEHPCARAMPLRSASLEIIR